MNIVERYFGNRGVFLVFLCFFFIIYFNNETLPNNLCTFVNQPCQYIAVLGMVLYVTRASKHLLVPNSNTLTYAIIMSLCVAIAGFFDRTFSNGYILTIMNILLASMMASILPFSIFKKYYIHIIVFLCLCSLLMTYIARPFLPMLPLQHVVNSAQTPFTNAIVCYVIDFDSYLRNTGIFREAGVWGAFVLLAIMLLIPERHTFSNKRYNIYLIILVVTVLSTFSTACLLALGAYLIVSIATRNMSLGNNKLVVVFIAAFMVLVLRNMDYLDLFNESVGKLSTDSSSYQARTDVYTNALPMIFSNVFGHGILNGASGLMLGHDESTFHNTSTIITSCIYFGIVFFCIYFYGFLRFCKRRLSSILFIIPLLIILNAEQYIFNPIFYMLVFYGISNEIENPLQTLRK